MASAWRKRSCLNKTHTHKQTKRRTSGLVAADTTVNKKERLLCVVESEPGVVVQMTHIISLAICGVTEFFGVHSRTGPDRVAILPQNSNHGSSWWELFASVL